MGDLCRTSYNGLCCPNDLCRTSYNGLCRTNHLCGPSHLCGSGHHCRAFVHCSSREPACHHCREPACAADCPLDACRPTAHGCLPIPVRARCRPCRYCPKACSCPKACRQERRQGCPQAQAQAQKEEGKLSPFQLSSLQRRRRPAPAAERIVLCGLWRLLRLPLFDFMYGRLVSLVLNSRSDLITSTLDCPVLRFYFHVK